MTAVTHDRATSDARDLRVLQEPVGTRASSVVDTTEIRWFGEGRLPHDVGFWFTRADTAGMVEERCDTYRVDGRPDRGLKRRFRRTLELKVRRSVDDPLVLSRGLAGQLERWRRWSPADHLVETDHEAPWIDVHKVVVKRRFSIDGSEMDVSETTPDTVLAGCDVEVVAITVGDQAAWSFAFATFGREALGRDAVVACWQALVAESPCPSQLLTSFHEASGYPHFLAALTADRVIELAS